MCLNMLTHWGRVTHICISELTIIVSDNGLSPGRRQAILWINAGILLIGPCGTNFSEILIAILIFSFTKTSLKVSSAKWPPFCLSLNVLKVLTSVADHVLRLCSFEAILECSHSSQLFSEEMFHPGSARNADMSNFYKVILPVMPL